MSPNPSNPKDSSDFQPPPELVAQAQAAATGYANAHEHSHSRHSHDATNAPASSSDNARGPRSMFSDVHESPIEHAPPPAYSQTYGNVDLSQGGIDTKASVASRSSLQEKRTV